jgi:hypothetical protein
MSYAPSSYIAKGMSASPEKTVGIPTVNPENNAVPPRCSAYALAEDTVTKNENYLSCQILRLSEV